MTCVVRRKSLRTGAATLALFSLVASCGGGGGHDITAPTPVATQIVVSPATSTVIAGQQATFTAVAKDASGNAVNESLTWSSSNPTVASVASGTVQALTAGTTTIRATDGTINGDATLTVLVPISDILVTPASPIVLINQTAQLTATPRDVAGVAIAGRTVTWASSNDAIASVTPAGLVTGKTPGTATISASAEGKTGSTSVTVRSPVASVAVAPTTLTLAAGKSSTLTATVKDAAGTTLTDRTVAWSSSDPTKASVTNGVVTAITAGTTTITAASEGQSATSTITVVDLSPPSVASVSTNPSAANVSSGAQVVAFSANVLDAGGAGVMRVDFALSAPAGAPAYTCSSMAPSAGSTSNGTWSCPITVPAGSVQGDWTISVVVIDVALNRRSLSSANLATAGLQSKLTVTDLNPDTTPPALASSLGGIPPQVDVTAGPVTLPVSIQLTDAGSGVARFDLSILAPDNVTSVGCSASAPSSGDRSNGLWQCNVTIPKGTQPGNWSIAVRAIDAAFNTYVTTAGVTLNVVSSNPDLIAPTFASLSVSPTTADISSGAQTITATAHLTDAGTGVASFLFRATAPDNTVAQCVADHPATGTAADGTWSCQLTIPPSVTTGDWLITVQATDTALNHRVLGNGGDAMPAGFPTKITVISP